MFFQKKEAEIHQEMKKISCNKWISIDDTFKVAANVGYFRSDKTWVTQYRSLFIVLNERGQVLTWQFTKSEVTSEVSHLLEGLRCRLRMQNAAVQQVILDDCCKWHPFLQSMFGMQVQVKLDIFHAVQRITRTISKAAPFYRVILNDLRTVFRAVGDIGVKRSLPTPEATAIAEKLETFTARWKTELSQKTLKEITNLKKHIDKGCLSGIPPGMVTNRNEVLHKTINPYFNKATLGVRGAYAILCLLFYLHNKKKSADDDNYSAMSLHSASVQTVYHDHFYHSGFCEEQIGIKGTNAGNKPFWGTNETMSYQHALEEIERIDGVNSSTMTLETAKDIITDVLNMTEVVFAMKELYGKSPLLQTEFLPFFTNLNVQHEPTTAVLDSEEKHQAYLNNLIGLCGMKRLEMEKDGNCFYTSTAAALKVLWDNVSADKKNQLKRLPIDIKTEPHIMSSQLRNKICKEWIDHGESYQGFLQHCNVNDEAIRFLQDGYFASELGDTVLMALANCLSIPVVALSSHAGILMFKPREYLSFTPIILAYNAYGPCFRLLSVFYCKYSDQKIEMQLWYK